MVGVVSEESAPVSTRTEHAPTRWREALAPGVALLASAAPLAIGAIAPRWIENASYAGLTSALVLAPLAAALSLYLAGRSDKLAPAWLAALSTILAVGGAVAVSVARSDIAMDWTALTATHAAAFAPAIVATFLRSAGNLANERAARRAVGGASALTVVQFALLAMLAAADKSLAEIDYPAVFLTALYGAAAFGPVWVAACAAVRQGKFPVRYNADPPYGHITSLSALALLLFIAVIAGLGLWSEYRGVDARITGWTGLATVIGLAVIFALVALAPTSQQATRQIDAFAEGVERAFGGLSKFFSWIDAGLVFAVAPVAGATQTRRTPRYGLLFGHVLAAAALGWWAPAPYGLAPLIVAFIAALSIARRWAWVEEDRENVMLSREFSGAHVRVGFSNDLRDESLLGFMALFLLVPFALRQLHIADGGHMFVINETSSVDDVLGWVGFFGTELAKALPFVDWAEVYHVEGLAPVSMDDSKITEAQHAVFVTRVIVDLVFLAALLQALAGLQRSKKLKDMFYKDRTISWLDPFAERPAFRALAEERDGAWALVRDVPEQFWSYDEDRLAELANDGDDARVAFVASRILERNEERTPEQLLLDEARLKTRSPERLQQLIERVREERPEPEISPLKLALMDLANDRRWSIRMQIAQMIAENWRQPGAVTALCDLIMSPSIRDPRAEIRLVALRALEQAALLEADRTARVAIKWASTQDASTRVTSAADLILKQNPGWDLGGDA